MKKNNNEKKVSVDEMKKNISKKQEENSNLIPEYLDNVMKKNNIKAKQIKKGDEDQQLKYIL